MPVELQKHTLDVGLVTKNLASAKRFYSEVLGLPAAGEIELPNIGKIYRYAVGDNTLRIFLPEALPALEGSREGFASQTGIRYLTLYVNNLDQVVADVARAGFKVAVPVRDLRPGIRVAQVEDADGNAIELMQED